MPKVKAKVSFAARGKPVELETKEINTVINEAPVQSPAEPVKPAVDTSTAAVTVDMAPKSATNTSNSIKIEKLNLNIDEPVTPPKSEKVRKIPVKIEIEPEVVVREPIRRQPTPSIVDNIDPQRQQRFNNMRYRGVGVPPESVIKKKQLLKQWYARAAAYADVSSDDE
jgi:hypothetical protein